MANVYKFASLRTNRKGEIELCVAHNEGYDEKIRISLDPAEALPVAEAIDAVTGTIHVRNMIESAVSAREQEKERLRAIIRRTQKKLEELE